METLFRKILKICRITYKLRLRVCNVSGIEWPTSLEKDFLQASRVFSWEFFKNFRNTFSGEYLLQPVARRYFIKKVFSPNSSFIEKEKVLTFTLCTLCLIFSFKRWRNEKYQQHCAHYS